MNFADWTSFLPSYFCHPILFPAPQLLSLEPPRTEECSQTPPLLKTEFSSDEGDFRIVEENLAKIHMEGNKHRKTHWTASEDRLLAELVEIRKLEWREISVHFPQRTQNMCYSRYRRISLGGKDRQWTPQDDQAASGWVARLGEKWKLISARMPSNFCLILSSRPNRSVKDISTTCVPTYQSRISPTMKTSPSANTSSPTENIGDRWSKFCPADLKAASKVDTTPNFNLYSLLSIFPHDIHSLSINSKLQEDFQFRKACHCMHYAIPCLAMRRVLVAWLLLLLGGSYKIKKGYQEKNVKWKVS